MGEAGSETSGARFCSAVPLGSSKVDKFGKEALNWGQERHKVVSLRAFKDLLCGDKGHSGLELT